MSCPTERRLLLRLQCTSILTMWGWCMNVLVYWRCEAGDLWGKVSCLWGKVWCLWGKESCPTGWRWQIPIVLVPLYRRWPRSLRPFSIQRCDTKHSTPLCLEHWAPFHRIKISFDAELSWFALSTMAVTLRPPMAGTSRAPVYVECRGYTVYVECRGYVEGM